MFWAWYLSRIQESSAKITHLIELIGDDDAGIWGDEEARQDVVRVVDYTIGAKPKGIDAPGQAGMIKGAIDRLETRFRAHLKICYLRGQERREACSDMAGVVLPMLGGAVNRRALAEAVGIVYGSKKRMQAVADRYKIDRRTVGKHMDAAIKVRRAVGERAEILALDALKGVVA